MFRGTGAEGADCTPPSDGDADLRLSAISCRGDLACRLYRGADGQPQGVCEPRDDDGCSHRFDCPGGEWCDLPDGWEPGRWGACRPLKTNGWSCDGPHQCESGYCDRTGTCAPAPEERHCSTTTYRGAVLDDVPVGYWRFDEPPTGELRDDSGHAESGAYEGSLESVQGALSGDESGAIAIDASGEGAIVPELDRYFSEGQVTLEAWVRRAPDSGTGPLIDVGEEDALGVRLWLHDGPDRAYANLSDDTGTSRPIYSDEGAVAPDRWYHLAATYDGSVGRLYVDGELVGEPLSEAFDPRTTGSLRIGHRAGDDRHITGAVDEVAVYARSLSHSQIRRHARIGRDGAEPRDFVIFGWLR